MSQQSGLRCSLLSLSHLFVPSLNFLETPSLRSPPFPNPPLEAFKTTFYSSPFVFVSPPEVRVILVPGSLLLIYLWFPNNAPVFVFTLASVDHHACHQLPPAGWLPQFFVSWLYLSGHSLFHFPFLPMSTLPTDCRGLIMCSHESVTPHLWLCLPCHSLLNCAPAFSVPPHTLYMVLL